MFLTDLAAACRKSGLVVVELPGWKTRGRPESTGGFDPDGVQCHHTGSAADTRAYAEWMAFTGRPDLPAPLSQLALAGDCVVYVMAAGRANHAGASRAHGTIPATSNGNRVRLGIEAMNTGFEGWKSTGSTRSGEVITQYEAYARLVAALCAHYGWKVENVAAHFEVSLTGKWDPGDPAGVDHNGQRVMDMNKFRARVKQIITEGVDDMPSPKDVWDEKIPEFDNSTDKEEQPARVLLAQTHNRAGDARDLAVKAFQSAKRTEKAVAAIGDALDTLVPGVKQAVQDALTEAVVDVDVSIRTPGGSVEVS